MVTTIAIRYLSLISIIWHQSCANEFKINNQLSYKFEPELYTQTTNDCPRQFTGWNLIKTFETKTYSLALCQQGNSSYLVGHEKQQHEAFIDAKVICQDDDLIVAQDEYGFSFEIKNNQLKVTKNQKLMAQEKILN